MKVSSCFVTIWQVEALLKITRCEYDSSQTPIHPCRPFKPVQRHSNADATGRSGRSESRAAWTGWTEPNPRGAVEFGEGANVGAKGVTRQRRT